MATKKKPAKKAAKKCGYVVTYLHGKTSHHATLTAAKKAAKKKADASGDWAYASRKCPGKKKVAVFDYAPDAGGFVTYSEFGSKKRRRK